MVSLWEDELVGREFSANGEGNFWTFEGLQRSMTVVFLDNTP
jgi:hypothetical protein